MSISITSGRTWVTGETVTAAKLNNSFSSASVNYGAYQDASGTYNAASGDFVWVGTGDTVNLPSGPSNNDIVVVAQSDGDLSATSSTVNGNGKSINFNAYNSVAADTSLTLNANFISSLHFTFNSTEDVWKLTGA